jgi:hypothetical protein
MTREQAKQLIPIIREYANGAEVQWLDDNNQWADTEDPLFFGGDPERYRIKPETPEIWAVCYLGGHAWFDTEADATKNALPGGVVMRFIPDPNYSPKQ